MGTTNLGAAPRQFNAYRRFVGDSGFRLRALTIGNTANVVVSAAVFALSFASGQSGVWAWLQLLFPVVWAAVGAPILCGCIIAVAAAMSLLALFRSGPGQRWRAWLRSFTTWGAVVLALAFLLGLFLLSSRAFAGL